MRKATALLVLLLLSLSAAAIAQDVSKPLAETFAVTPLSRVQTVSFGPLDRGWLAVDDVARKEQGLAPRYAVPHTVHLTPKTSGTWEELPDGQWLWRLRIRAEAAVSLNLGFTRFKLPAGGRLQVYSADLEQAVRPFTSEDGERHSELWTPAVPTDDLVVELAVPAAARGDVDLELGQIGQGYRGFGDTNGLTLKSGSCNMDVACLNSADPWRRTASAVARISIGGSTLCTGSLVNDTARDHKMYFITAQHCGLTNSNAASLVAYWNYQNSTCRTPGSAASSGAGDGQLNQFHTGSVFRAENSASDFTLVELVDPPVPAFNHYWEGWDRSDGDVSCPQGNCFQCSSGALCAGIHHPSGNEKRITFAAQSILPASGDDRPDSPGDGTHLWVHWNPNPVFPPNPSLTIPPQVTEPGSSGSPLYNKNRRFIGQLHGGLSACGATGDNLSDVYGRFSVSWTVAAPYLDAGNTGALFIDGQDSGSGIFSDGFESGTLAAWSGAAP
jgi:lysyl endopeptidase